MRENLWIAVPVVLMLAVVGAIILVISDDRTTVWHGPSNVHCPTSSDDVRTCVDDTNIVYTCIRQWHEHTIDWYCGKKITP